MNTVFVVWCGAEDIHACFIVSPKSSLKAHLQHLKEDLEYALGGKFEINRKNGSDTQFEIVKE